MEILNLVSNKISNIDILEKSNFQELKELNLSSNRISDIKVLEKVKFEKLEIIYLEENKIEKNKFSSIIEHFIFKISI